MTISSVVDSDAETDHQADVQREVGNLSEVAGKDYERTTQADAEQRHTDGQTHRQHRTEGDDQDDDREREAEQLGRRLLELRKQEPAHLDPHTLDVRRQVAHFLTDIGRA